MMNFAVMRPWDETPEHREEVDGLLDQLRTNGFFGTDNETERLDAVYRL